MNSDRIKPKRKDEVPALRPHDLAYFEYTMAPTGEYRGIVHTHRTIMHQMSVLSALVQTAPSPTSARDTIASALRDKNGQRVAGGGAGEIIFSYLDPRQSIGLILGVLLTVFGGHTTVWAGSESHDHSGSLRQPCHPLQGNTNAGGL